jgi:hypothetical protein
MEDTSRAPRAFFVPVLLRETLQRGSMAALSRT